MKIVSSPLLSSHPKVIAFFTTRHGGISQEPYDTANLAFHVGDNLDHVLVNHASLAASVGYDHHRLIHMRQIHSDRIVIADATMNFDTPPECDALITDHIDIPLMVMSADCTPVLLYDPVHHAIGAVHAGRAGALNAILPKTINRMRDTYGTNIRDLRISLGPSIHGCCYEINAKIAAEVEKNEYASALRRNGDNVYLDVNSILRMQMEAMGIISDQIEENEACTSCRCHEYFSYRADKQLTGRIAGVIILRP